MSPAPRTLNPEPCFIAFDLDGVIYSSEAFIGEAYRETIARVNDARPGSFVRVPTTREILNHVGWPVRLLLQRLFPRLDPKAARLFHDDILGVICTRIASGEGHLYPEVPETLQALQIGGHRLAIASNGRARYVETVLDTYGLADRFVDRVTADHAGDKTAVLRTYLDRHGVDPAHVVMVGDRATDVAAAQDVACYFVGCDYGHGYRHEIESAGPVVGRFRDLPDAIARVLRTGDATPSPEYS